MQLYKRKDSQNWWATWYDKNGKRNRRSLGIDDKKSAEALAAKWAQEDFLEEHFKKVPEVPFSEALLKYARAQRRDHPKHFSTNTRYLLKMLQSSFGSYLLSEINTADIRRFIDERRKTVKDGTVQKDVATLKAILNRAVEDGDLANCPVFPKMKPLKARNRYLTPDEENRLVLASAEHLVPLIRIAVETGGRLSELLNLSWSNVDMQIGSITFLDTKNGEDRTVRLTSRAKAVLACIGPKVSGPVFTYNGRAIKSVKTAFNKARMKAKLTDVRFHDLRHTFASRLVQCGIPLYDVMSLTGHKSTLMVQRYAHLAPDYQGKAIAALDGFWHNLGTVEPGGVRMTG